MAGGADQPEIYDPVANAFTLVTGPQLDGFLFSTATTLAMEKSCWSMATETPTAGAVRETWMWEP